MYYTKSSLARDWIKIQNTVLAPPTRHIPNTRLDSIENLSQQVGLILFMNKIILSHQFFSTKIDLSFLRNTAHIVFLF